MDAPEGRVELARSAVLTLAISVVAIHFATNLFTPYGVHRDEFLYLAMGRHLDLFRMEFPPAIAILARLSILFGDSLCAIRLFPAIAAGSLVFLSALIARELGGGRFAQVIAAIAVAASPLFLRAGNLFQPVVFDQLWWTLGLFALVRLGRTGESKWWVWYGAAIGFGLLTKFSAVFFGAATLLALIVSPQRRWLLTPWPWVALLMVAAIGSPSWMGQVRLDYPVIRQMQDLRDAQLERVTPMEFVIGQLQLGPAFIVALAGVGWLLLAPETAKYRIAGWTCLLAFLILLVLKGKPYYLGPVYPALFAAGGAAMERIRHPRLRPAALWASAILIVSYGLLTLPIGLPILSPRGTMTAYTNAIGASEANRTNRGELEELPQDYADMLGWPEMVAAVAEVYRALPPEDRARAVIIAGNYGEAGAIDFYGPRLGLPNAISTAGTYWFFGPGSRPGEVAVTLGIEAADLESFFAEVTTARRFTYPGSVSEERNIPINVARRPYRTLQQLWPSLAGRN
ncbi:MAG: ArnT family glycosyltransferase [Gemmatimonadaceae bacterium]